MNDNNGHKLSVIIPAYRQARTIVRDVRKIESTLEKIRYPFEIIVVVDGFGDGTYHKVRQIISPSVKTTVYMKNQGKGHAARRYYFAIQAKKGCAASDLSNEWWGTPGGVRFATGGVTNNNFVPTNNTEAEPTVAEPEPTVAESVQGVMEEEIPSEPTYYQAPPTNSNPFVPQPTPKPLSFWEKILRIFIK